MTKVVIAPPAYRVVKTTAGYKLVAAATQGPPGAGRIPGGGALDVLQKGSGADYDVRWRTPAQLKGDLSLDLVDNTRDADKPVSAAQAAAIALAISELIAGAGPAYDTLVELQNIILADETAASALAALVATKVGKAGDTMTGSLLATDAGPDLGDATHRFRDLNLSRYIVLGGMLIPTALYDGTTLQINAPTGKTVNLGINSGWGLSYKAGGACVNAADCIGWGGSSVRDTAFSRVSAGKVALGTGAQGDKTGTLQLTTVEYASGGTASSTSAGLGITGFVGGMVLNVGNFGGGVLAARFTPTGVLQWDAASATNNTPDTGISRVSAGVIAAGTGAQGARDGSFQAARFHNGAAITVIGDNSFGTRADGGIIDGNNSVAVGWSAGNIAVRSNGVFGWTNTTANATAALTTRFTSPSPGVVSLDGSASGDGTGSLQLANLTAGNNVNLSAGGGPTTNAVKWASEASLWATGTNNFTLNMGNSGAGIVFAFTLNANTSTYKLEGRSTFLLGWNASTIGTGATDVGLSRLSAGMLGLGTGAQGGVTGKLTLRGIYFNTGPSHGLENAGASDLWIFNGGSSRALAVMSDVVDISSYGNVNTTQLCIRGAAGFISWTAETSWTIPGTSVGVSRDSGLSRVGAAQLAVGNGTRANDDGQLWLAGVRKKPRTVATLPTPTAGIAGLEMVVSDANATAYAASLTGGGSDTRGARCTGSAWIAC